MTESNGDQAPLVLFACRCGRTLTRTPGEVLPCCREEHP